jgi:microcystin-dependent protein
LSENAFLWSITAADNATADPGVPWVENMLPGAVNNVARAEMAAVARLLKDLTGSITTGGSSNTYTATSNSGHTAYANNILITAKANHTNTGAATLNLNTYGAKAIKVFTGGAEADVAAGQIISGGRYQFAYDTALASAAGAWLLLNPAPDPISLIKVGQTVLWHTDTLPSGYLWANGEAVSRTTYAALFAIIGTTYGAGDGSTTFNLPDLCGRAPFGSDDMGAITLKSRITNAGSGIVGTTLGASGGAESVTLTLAQSPAHTHAGTTSTESATHTHSGTTATEDHALVAPYQGPPSDRDATPAAGSGGDVWGGPPVLTDSSQILAHVHGFTTGTESATHTHTYTTDSKGGGALHTNMPPALITNFIIKY